MALFDNALAIKTILNVGFENGVKHRIRGE
jgi:hypothetical protein